MSATAAHLVLTILNMERPESLQVPYPYLVSSPVVSLFVGSLLLAHLGLGLCAYVVAYKQGLARVLFPGVFLMLSIPLIILDFWLSGETGLNQVIAESLVWLYGIIHLGVLLAESRGQKGLLKRTADSLVQTTQELQHSYAELEQVQSELQKKEQLAAVGELAATIAHEVRNPLAVIKNAVSGLRRQTISPQDQEILISIVDEEAERLNQLVSELLHFARPIDASCAAVSLREFAKALVGKMSLDHRIELLESAPDLKDQVWIDSELFQIAIDNLVVNAEQAMKEQPDGNISIHVMASELKDGRRAVSLSVNDEGPGMNQDEKLLALKPFHTTRPRGSGLGLPIVERIVQANGGELVLGDSISGGCSVQMVVPQLSNTEDTD